MPDVLEGALVDEPALLCYCPECICLRWVDRTDASCEDCAAGNHAEMEDGGSD